MEAETINPADYMQDAQGRLVPRTAVAEIDMLRDELVREMAQRHRALQTQMAQCKKRDLQDVAAFVELSAERYQVQLGGARGNITLTSYCGRWKVVRQVADSLAFDERLQIAKKLVDQCLRTWSNGADDRLRALVSDAFQVDKTGRINVGRVLSLRRIEIKSDEWKRAMDAISDSIRVVASSTYIRIYERVGEADQYRPITLDFAAL